MGEGLARGGAAGGRPPGAAEAEAALHHEPLPSAPAQGVHVRRGAEAVLGEAPAEGGGDGSGQGFRAVEAEPAVPLREPCFGRPGAGAKACAHGRFLERLGVSRVPRSGQKARAQVEEATAGLGSQPQIDGGVDMLTGGTTTSSTKGGSKRKVSRLEVGRFFHASRAA